MGAITTCFYELLADTLRTHSDKTAIIDPGRSVTYAELEGEAVNFAAQLHAAGIGAGDRVVIQLRKSIAEVAAMFGVARLGAVIVNVHAQWTAEQLLNVVKDCGAATIIVEPSMARRLTTAHISESVRRVVVAGPAPESPRFQSSTTAAHCSALPSASPLDSDLAMLIYTSGSTGGPKGVMLSHRNLLAGARSVARYLELGGDDRLLSVLPYCFDYGLNQLTTMMLLGGTVIHQPVPMPAEIIATAARHGATGLAAVPPLWGQIVRLQQDSPTILPALRRITNSGGSIAKNILEQMPAAFPGTKIYLMYGLTEAFRSTYLPPADFMLKMGSIGRAIPGAEIHVIKHGIGPAGRGEQGELVHRGPLVSMGYWGLSEKSRERIRPCPELNGVIGDEPVVYSGDTVRIDEDGYLWFVGRTDALIKTQGFRVSPDEVEDLLCRSGLVADAVAFGVEDSERGQAIHAAIAPLPDFSERALRDHCRAIMPGYMQPVRFHIWTDPMPRTASGKLARTDVVRNCTAEAVPHDQTQPSSIDGGASCP